MSVCQGIPEPPPHLHKELRSDQKAAGTFIISAM